MGYKRVVLKSDQESSIVKLKVSVTAAWDGEIVMEESPVGEHQSNGRVERAIQTIQGMVRTYRDALESRYGMRLDGTNNSVPWMVMHAASMVSNYAVGNDGRTAVERLKGKLCRKQQLEFGECVMYLKPKTVGKDKADDRWEKRCIPRDQEPIGGILHWDSTWSTESQHNQEVRIQRGKLEQRYVHGNERHTMGAHTWA